MQNLPGEYVTGSWKSQNRNLTRDFVPVALSIKFHRDQRTFQQGAGGYGAPTLREPCGRSQPDAHRCRRDRIADRQFSSVGSDFHHDSLTLANCLHVLESNTPREDRVSIQDRVEINALSNVQVGE